MEVHKFNGGEYTNLMGGAVHKLLLEPFDVLLSE